MRDLRIQYVLTFAMLGTVLPYVSVFFRQAGLSPAQVGLAWAIWSAGLMVSPAVITMLADAHIDPRRLLSMASVVSALALLALGFADGVWAVLGVWAVYCFASMPILPLQDGIHFSQQRRRRENGDEPTPYPRVRIWGTIGYMVPSVLLFALLWVGMSLRVVLMTGFAFGILAALQANRLRDPRAHGNSDAQSDSDADDRLPTVAAARVLLQPNLLVFTAALLVVSAVSVVHGAFFPIYLTEQAGVAEQWLGQISNLAVFIEIFFVTGCGALLARFGVKWVLLAAMAVTAMRFGMLAATTNAWVAVGTQIFHGLTLIAVGVIPQMVLDEAAEDRFRHSMQGVYVMVGGAGRTVANLLAGPIAAWSLTGLYGIAAVLCGAAALLVFVAFREPRPGHAPAERDDRTSCPAPAALAGGAPGAT
jgi:PPP family 3-phenylpropionic acid transporter